jgi:hypothetical protein
MLDLSALTAAYVASCPSGFSEALYTFTVLHEVVVIRRKRIATRATS